jgi:hypothetical protein
MAANLPYGDRAHGEASCAPGISMKQSMQSARSNGPHTVELTGRVGNRRRPGGASFGIVAAFGRAILPRTCKYRRLEFSAPVSHDALRALALSPDVSCAHVRGRIAPGRYC